MSFFKLSSAKKSFLGVDFGTGGIKIVELGSEKNRPRLWTYATSQNPHASNPEALLDDVNGTAALLRDMAKAAGVKSRSVLAAVPQPMVFDALFSFPKTKEKDGWKAQVEPQMRKIAPVPLEELTLETHVLEEEDASGPWRVLAVGVPKTWVQKTVALFRKTGWSLLSLETESFALTRSLVGKDRSAVLIVDVGSRRTNLTWVWKNIPLLTRSIQVGGDLLTQTLAAQMAVSWEEAEQMKQDIGRREGLEPPPFAQPFLQPILNEIRYVLGEAVRQEALSSAKVEKVIFTGGSSHLAWITPFFSQALGVNVYLGDPWARVMAPSALKPVLQDMGSRFAVAVGLAMRPLIT